MKKTKEIKGEGQGGLGSGAVTVGMGGAKVGQKRRSRHTGHGVGDENLKDKRLEETRHKQKGVQGREKGIVVEKRKRPASDAGGTEKKKQRGQGVGGAGY